MTIKIYWLLAAFLLIIGLGITAYWASHNGPRQARYMAAVSIPLSHERIGNVALNQSLDDMIPAPIANPSNSLFDYYTLIDGTSIATKLDDDRIIRITIIGGSSNATSKGIRIGDSKQTILRTYGKHYYTRTEQGSTIIGYVDKTLDHTLEFWMVNDRVSSIRLDISSMD